MDTTCVNGVLLTPPPRAAVANAAQPPKHRSRHVSPAGRVQHGLPEAVGSPPGDFRGPHAFG